VLLLLLFVSVTVMMMMTIIMISNQALFDTPGSIEVDIFRQ